MIVVNIVMTKPIHLIESINFYQNIISCNGGKFYYMSMSQYDKLLSICNVYDDSQKDSK